MSRALAIDTIQLLDLEAMIRTWNSGQGSLIASFEDFEVALTFFDDKNVIYVARCKQADAAGQLEDFLHETHARLHPVITGSFVVAVRTICDRWADHAMCIDPGTLGLDGIFDNKKSWIEWAVANIGGPVDLCGPYGAPVVDEDSIVKLLSAALSQGSRDRRLRWIAGVGLQ